MRVSTELMEIQEATIKHFRKAVKNVSERFTVSKTLDKQMETILSYLEKYEIMYSSLINVREVCSKVMESEELEAIEGEMKVLIDTFWN